MRTQTFFIKSYVDAAPDFAAAGKAFYDDVAPLVADNVKIIFDMTGQEAVSTVFLNTSFGFLIDRFGIEKVRGSFLLKNILRSQAERIRRYFDIYIETPTT